MIDDNILAFINRTPDAIIKSVANRVCERRLEKNLTQQAVATRAGMSLSSYRRFEQTGEIAFRSLVMIAIVLDTIDDFKTLFATKTYQSIDEIVNEKEVRRRRRGKKNE